MRLFATLGVRDLADTHGAYWLLDAISSYQTHNKLCRDCGGFQLWLLNVADDNTAVLICRRDTNEPILVQQRIDYTDYPKGNHKFYVCNGTIMLPDEY